jgi:hypothetical protein
LAHAHNSQNSDGIELLITVRREVTDFQSRNISARSTGVDLPPLAQRATVAVIKTLKSVWPSGFSMPIG